MSADKPSAYFDDLFKEARQTKAHSPEELDAIGDLPVNDASGHRKRLRDRFARHGADGFADYELLELFLFRSIPRRDTKGLAKALLKRFKTMAEIFSAPRHRLLEVDGVGEASALDLSLVRACALRLLQDGVENREILASWADVLEYCRAAMAYETVEQFRIIFLDKRNHIIANEVQQQGTVDHTPVYQREIIKRALELSATALILVHNHPSGDPQPSRADIDMTKKIVESANSLGITIHDHIIIGREGHASFRGLGLI